MASWADNIEVLGNFNPYIETLPSEAIYRVQQFEQDKLDQAVRTTQGYVDYLAGLPIAKKEGQQYMNAKLGQLRDYVNTNITGNFSDQRLMNQIGGLSKQIASDPIIQRQVQNTLLMQKRDQEAEDYKKAGKSAEANDWDYFSKRNGWLNDGDLTSDFNASYSPYVDVNKKWLDVLKSIAPNAKIEDIPFVIRPDGTIDSTKIANAMVERGIKGIDKNRIENAIRASLDEQDLNQLSISGRFRFRNYTPDMLAAQSEQKYNQMRENTQAQIELLRQKATLSKGDPQTYNFLISRIKDLETDLGTPTQKGRLQIDHEDELNFIQNNPEEAKAQIYKNGYIKEFANAFSWEESTLKYNDNPLRKQENWNRQFALDQAKEARMTADSKFDQWYKTQNLGIEREKLNLKLKELYGSGYPFITFWGEDTKDLPNVTQAMTQDIVDKNTQANDLIGKIAQSENVSRDAVESAIQQQMSTGKSTLSPSVQSVASEIIRLRNEASRIENALTDTKANVIKDPRFTQIAQSREQKLSGRQDLIFTIRGQRLRFTPQEFADFLSRGMTPGQFNSFSSNLFSLRHMAYPTSPNALGKTVDLPGVGGSNLNNFPVTPRNQKEAILLEALRSNDPSLSQWKKQFTSVANSYENVLRDDYKIKDMVNEEVEKRLATQYPRYIPRTVNIQTTKPESRAFYEEILGSVANRIKADKGGNEGLKLSKLNDWLGDNKERANLQYSFLTQGGSDYLLIKNGDETQKVKLTPIEANQVRTFGNIPSGGPEYITDQVTLGGGYTNSKLNPSFDKALFQKWDFPNVKGLNVSMDVSRDLGQPNVLRPELWLQLGNGNAIHMPLNNAMDSDNINKLRATLTDKQIKELFSQAFKDNPQILEQIKGL